MKTYFVGILALNTTCSASLVGSLWRDVPYFGKGPNPIFDNQSAEIFQQAISAPNTTRQISFLPFGIFRGNAPQLGQDEWTWRVNITEYGLSHLEKNLTDYGVNITNPRYVSTSYDLSWPLGGNLSRGLRGSRTPFCAYALDIEFYANVTNLWTEEDANSTSCKPVLGEDCLNRLYSQANFLNGDKCLTRSPIFFEVPECSATLGYGAKIYTSALLDLQPKSSNTTQGSRLPIESGGGLLGFGSGVVDGANATQTYLAATNRIQMLLFGAWVGEVGNIRVSRPNILCMRVNSTKLSVSMASATAGTNWVGLILTANLAILFLFL